MATATASNSGKLIGTATITAMTQLRQKLNDELKSLNIAGQINQNKDEIIKKTTTVHELLTSELQRLQSFNANISTTTKHVDKNAISISIENNYNVVNVTNEWTTYYVMPNYR